MTEHDIRHPEDNWRVSVLRCRAEEDPLIAVILPHPGPESSCAMKLRLHDAQELLHTLHAAVGVVEQIAARKTTKEDDDDTD